MTKKQFINHVSNLSKFNKIVFLNKFKNYNLDKYPHDNFGLREIHQIASENNDAKDLYNALPVRIKMAVKWQKLEEDKKPKIVVIDGQEYTEDESGE